MIIIDPQMWEKGNLMQFEKIIKYIFPQFVIRRLEGRKNLQKILANTSWLFFDKILRMGVGLFVGAWVARYLGPEQFGLLSYAMVFIALFGAIATLGLDGIVVKELVKYPEKKDFILGSAFALKFLGGWVVLFLSSVCIYLVRPKDTLVHWLVIVISAGTIFQAFDTIDFWFQAQLKSYYTVIAKNSAFVLISIAKIIFIFKKAPLVFFGFAAFFEIVIGSFFMIIAYNHNKLHLKYWKIDWGTIKNLFEQSWPLIFAGIAILIYMKIDQIMLGQMIGDKEVGIYSAAVRISEIWYFIPIVITSSIYPALVKMHQESEEKYYEKLMEIMGYFFWGTLIFSVIFTYFSQSIIYLIYGKDYSAATNVLSIHIYSGIIVSMSVVFSQKFVLDGTTKVSLYGTVVGASSNIFLNLWLIKPYKSQGAAIATLISYVIPVLFQSIFFDRKIGKTFLLSIFWILKSKKKYT